MELIRPASDENTRGTSGCTVVNPISAHAVIHRIGAVAMMWNRCPYLSMSSPTTGLSRIGRIFCPVDRNPATASVYPRMKMMSAEFTLNPPAAPLCSSCVAGSMRYAQGSVSRMRNEKTFLTASFSVVMTRSRSDVRRNACGTRVRSKRT